MRHQVRMLGICLAAVFAIGAIGAVAASAKLPEWGSCEPAAGNTGKYGNPGCTAPVKKVRGQYLGGYEWTPIQESDEAGAGASGPRDERVPSTDVKIQLADGRSITCSGLGEEQRLEMTSPQSTVRAPLFDFSNCHDDEGGECTTAGYEAITTEREWELGILDEPGSWKGSLRFIEDRNGPSPVVGVRYQAELGKEEEPGTHPRLFQQIVCEKPTDINALVIGGHKKGETLTAELTQVNEMRRSYTVTLDQSNGVQLPTGTKLYAQANGGEWETVGIQATTLFPEVLVVGTFQEELEIKTIK